MSRLPIILAEFEEDARRLANSVQRMMENLSSQLHNVRQRIFDRVIKNGTSLSIVNTSHIRLAGK